MQLSSTFNRVTLVILIFSVTSSLSIGIFEISSSIQDQDPYFPQIAKKCERNGSSGIPYVPFLNDLFYYNTFLKNFSLETISAYIDYDRDVLIQYDGIDFNRHLIDVNDVNWDLDVLQNTTIAFYGTKGHLKVSDLPEYFPYFFPIISNMNNSGLLVVASPKPLTEFILDIKSIESALDPLKLSLNFIHCAKSEFNDSTYSYAIWDTDISPSLLNSIASNKGLAELCNTSYISMDNDNGLSIAFLRSSNSQNSQNDYTCYSRIQYKVSQYILDDEFYIQNVLGPISPNKEHNISLGILVAPPSSETEIENPFYYDSLRPQVKITTINPWFDGSSKKIINPLILPINLTAVEEEKLNDIFDGPQFLAITIYNIHVFSSEINKYVDIFFPYHWDLTDLGFRIKKAPYISELTSVPTAELEFKFDCVNEASVNQSIEISLTTSNIGSKAAYMPIINYNSIQDYGILISFSGYPHILKIDDYITIEETTYPLSGDFLVLESGFEDKVLLYANSFQNLSDSLQINPIMPGEQKTWKFSVRSEFPGELEIPSAYANYMSVEYNITDLSWIPTPFPPPELNQSAFGLEDFIEEMPFPFPFPVSNVSTYFCLSGSKTLEIKIIGDFSDDSIEVAPFFVGLDDFSQLLIISISMLLLTIIKPKKSSK